MKRMMIALTLACLLALSGCADVQHITGLAGEPAGFWAGLWHGMILPFAIIGRLISNNIAIYAVNNSGGWYDFGFIVGASASIGGGSSAATK